jgi:hypothetical protein
MRPDPLHRHLLKFLLLSAFSFFVGTIHGMLQVMPPIRAWLDSIGSPYGGPGRPVSPCAHEPGGRSGVAGYVRNFLSSANLHREKDLLNKVGSAYFLVGQYRCLQLLHHTHDLWYLGRFVIAFQTGGCTGCTSLLWVRRGNFRNDHGGWVLYFSG